MAFVSVGAFASGKTATSSAGKSIRYVPRAALSTKTTTRRAFLLSTLAVTLASTQNAIAGVDSLTQESATEVMRDARLELSDLSSAANMGEYEALRLELRKGSLGRIRLAGTTLSKSGDETRDAYRKLIGKVEQLDSHALRAERGGDTAVVTTDITAVQEAVDNLLEIVAK